MEYFISNAPFTGATKIASHLYIKGDFREIDDFSYLLEGYLIDEQTKTAEDFCRKGIESTSVDGLYNLFCINKKDHLLEIKTDKRGTIPFYLYTNGCILSISNNPWLLVQEYRDQISIDIDSLKCKLVYNADVKPYRTLFTSITRSEVAMYFKMDIHTGKWEKKCYWEFTYSPKEWKEKDLFERIDSDFTHLFQSVKEQNEDKICGLGCSGGLDSRIIAHYLHKTQIHTKPYVFCEKQKRKHIDTATYITSKRIAEYFGMNIKSIDFNTQQIQRSMLLDIRNNPFYTSQLGINLSNQLPYFDYMFTGQPGGYTYVVDAVASDSVENLKRHADFWMGYKKSSMDSLTTIARKFYGEFPFSFDKYADDGRWGLKHSKLHKIVGESDIEKTKETLFNTLDLLKGECNYESWIRFNMKVVRAYQYSGGYESINSTKKSYYSYLPFWENMIAELPLKFLLNKKLLKSFIAWLDPNLAHIPSQNLEKIGSGRLGKFADKIAFMIRTRGINVMTMIHSEFYKNFSQDIMKRDNPIFYSVVNKKEVLSSGILSTPYSSTLVKLKLLLDIFYYKEFDLLLSDPSLEKASWM